jgi:hypothetical protein
VGERASEGPIETAKDDSLADRARNGDLDAFEELMNARIDAIYRLSYAIVATRLTRAIRPRRPSSRPGAGSAASGTRADSTPGCSGSP